MGLFNKKKEETKSCCCGGNCTPESMAEAETAKATVGVKVLGAGCAKCNALEAAVRSALEELGMNTTMLRTSAKSPPMALCPLRPWWWTARWCPMARY